MKDATSASLVVAGQPAMSNIFGVTPITTTATNTTNIDPNLLGPYYQPFNTTTVTTPITSTWFVQQIPEHCIHLIDDIYYNQDTKVLERY